MTESGCCKFCQLEYIPKQRGTKFCSQSCAVRWNWANNPRVAEGVVASNKTRKRKKASHYHAEIAKRLEAIRRSRT